MSTRPTARSMPVYQPAQTLEVIARLSVAASIFSWMGVVLALFWH